MNAIAGAQCATTPPDIAPLLVAMRHRASGPPRTFAERAITVGASPLCWGGRLAVDAETSEARAALIAFLRGEITELNGVSDGYAFIAATDNGLVAGRDRLGVKPLYWTGPGETVMFASELKALTETQRPVHAFPPGHTWTAASGLRRRPDLNDAPDSEPEEAPAGALRTALNNAVQRRLPSSGEAGILLSGGLDSSIIATVAHRHAAGVRTFYAGTPDSEDRLHARAMARSLGARHHERIFHTTDARRVLPEVIFHLESFDYPLVRSAIANYMASGAASNHVSSVLCGEGADELFAGYEKLKRLPLEELDNHLWEMLIAGHNTIFQRVDRINAAHGMAGLMPFLDADVVDVAFRVAPCHKIHGENRTEKWIMRVAFEDSLPVGVAWRKKRKFSEGSGAAGLLASTAEAEVPDREFLANRTLRNGFQVRNKEEMLYFLLFRECFGDDPAVLDTVGITPR